MESLTQCETTTPLKQGIISCNHLSIERDVSIIPGKKELWLCLKESK
jgi:hypothetical protein